MRIARLPGISLLSNVHYNAFGVATGDTLGNGLAEARTTAPRGWLQSLTVGPSGSPAYDFDITSFAPNGDILSASDSVNANWSYGYDDFNRLISASATGQAYTYDYDRFGNRWHQNGPSSMMISFTGNNNLMDTYAYDAAGNLLNDGTHSYAYDGFGRLATVDGGTTATYYYDADDRRAEKASVAEYLYDLEGNVVAEMVPGTGGLQRGEVYAAGRHLATYWNSTTYFNHADWLGTERARTPYPGSAACETIASLPFGDGQVEAGSCGDPSTRHFTGKERDAESGLDNFRARYFGSSLGRFMSPDWSVKPQQVPYAVLDDPQSLNLFAYVRNNPLSRTDPDGHCGAPSGLKPGQTGICVASYIAKKVFWKFGLPGRGDGRGPDGNGGTSRIETRLVVDSKGNVTKTNETISRSGIAVKDVGPQGVGGSTISNTSTDKQGDTHFQVSQDAHTSYALGGALFGNIDNHLNLEVTPDQKVGIEADSTAKDFPSLEVFKYTMDDKGNIATTQIFTKQESNDVDDLKMPEQSIAAQEPK